MQAVTVWTCTNLVILLLTFLLTSVLILTCSFSLDFALLALDKTTLENGCLQISPGTHKLGKVEFGSTTSNDPTLDPELDAKVTAGKVYLTMEKGETVLLNNMSKSTPRRPQLLVIYRPFLTDCSRCPTLFFFLTDCFWLPVLHRSDANKSGKPRRGFSVWYTAAEPQLAKVFPEYVPRPGKEAAARL